MSRENCSNKMGLNYRIIYGKFNRVRFFFSSLIPEYSSVKA